MTVPLIPQGPTQDAGEYILRFRQQFGRDPTPDELASGTLGSTLQDRLKGSLFGAPRRPTLLDAVGPRVPLPTPEAQQISRREVDPYASMSPLTRTLGLSLGAASGAMTPVTFPYQVGHAVGTALDQGDTPADPRMSIASQPDVSAVRPAVSAPPTPVNAPHTELGDVAEGLNPVGLLARIDAGDPEAIGSIPGMLVGGELFHAAGGVDAGNLSRLEDQRAADAVARMTAGTPPPSPLESPTFVRRGTIPVATDRPTLTPLVGDLEPPTFARRAAAGEQASPGTATAPPPELLARADELAQAVPREPNPLEQAAGQATVAPELLDHADRLAQAEPDLSGVAGQVNPKLLLAGTGAAVGGVAGAALTPGDTKDKVLGALAGAATLGLGGAMLGRDVPPEVLSRADELAQQEPRGPAVPTATGTEPATEAADHLNLARMNLTPEAQATLEPKVVQAADELGVGGKPVRTFAEASAHAQELATDLPRLMQIPAARLSGEERLALRNVVNTDTERAVTLTKALNDPSTPHGALDDLRGELSQINQRQQQILPKLVQSGTQQGRDLAYNRILAEQTTDPSFWLERAQRVRGEDYPLNDLERAQVTKLAQDGNRQKLADYVAGLSVPTWQEKLVGLGKTNLISALTTASKIALTNAVELGRSAVTAPLEQTLDWMASGVSGVRSRMGLGRNLIDVAQRAASSGLSDVKQLARGETPAVGPQGGNLLMGNREMNYVAPDAGPVGQTLGAAANVYTHTVTRLHSVLHRATWQPAYQAALLEQGRILGSAEGLSGADLAARARALADNPTGEMFQRAVDAANRATFLDKSGVSTWLSQFARSGLAEGGIGGNLKYFGTQTVVPFARISTNIVKAGAEYSPLGAAMAVTHDLPAWLKAVKGGDLTEISQTQRAMIDRVGRAAPGTGAFLAGYLAYKAGTATSTEPESAKERDLWKNQGMGPNAIKTPSGWRNVLVTGPLGLSFAMGAAMAQATAKAQTPSDVASGTAVGAVRAIAEESFLRGIEDLGNALHDPAGAGTAFLRNTITSWSIPNLAASAAKATDPSQLGRVAKTIPQSAASRIPGERETLPPGVDAFGRPMLKSPTAGSVAQGMLDPSNPRANPSASDPVLAEMTRVGVRPTYAKQGPGETAQQYQARVLQQGAAYRRVAEGVIQGTFTQPNIPSYLEAPQLAQALVRSSPEFRGKDPAQVADELRAMALEHAFSGLRAALRRSQPPQAPVTDRQKLRQMTHAR